MRLLAPSRPSKHGGRDHLDVSRQEQPASPSKARFSDASLASSLNVFPVSSTGRKVPPPAPAKNAAPLALPLPAVLRQPEEQTDNWDDDFEEGISFSKLQGIRAVVYLLAILYAYPLRSALEKPTAEEERQPEHDDNAQTIRPTSRSPRLAATSVVSKSPPREMGPIVEDYSDLAVEEDDEWQEKFADFKMKTSVRRGLFHPDDIKTVGLAPPSPGPKTAPLPDIGVGRAPRQQSPVLPSSASASASPFMAPLPLSVRSHSRSPSLAGSASGSIGKSDARRLANSEFNKYAEDDDEDYDDVFGKPNGSCAWFFFFFFLSRLRDKML